MKMSRSVVPAIAVPLAIDPIKEMSFSQMPAHPFNFETMWFAAKGVHNPGVNWCRAKTLSMYWSFILVRHQGTVPILRRLTDFDILPYRHSPCFACIRGIKTLQLHS